MHPFELQTKVNHDLVIGYYVLAKEIRWQGKEQTVTVFKKGSATKKQLKVLKGALWVEDNFAQNEEILVYMDRNSGGSDYVEGNVYGIISSEFFHRVVSNKNPEGDLERLKELFALPKGLCKLAMAYVTGERKAYDMETITENAANSIFVGSFKNFVEPFMLPEQRAAYDAWSSSGVRSNRNPEKLKYIMNISPVSPYRDRKTISFNSIMAVFDRRIIGHTNMKRAIAMRLAEDLQKDRKRGLNILIHGLPGTCKSTWGEVIAEALLLHHKRIDLGNISSTLSLYGCESSYDNSEPGVPVKFWYECRTSETVITWDEIGNIAKPTEDSRGKDGHVLEGLLEVFDPSRRTLSDAFLDKVPMNLENTINICTANRIENLPEELKNRMDMIFAMEPYDEGMLLKIMQSKMAQIESEYNLPKKWIQGSALKRLLKYRADFGARDVLTGLKVMASYFKENNGTRIITTTIVDEVMPTVMDMNKAEARFHYYEEFYPEDQKQAILETVRRRITAENLSTQERRALDLKLDYLTKLIPNDKCVFDADTFFEAVNKKLYGMVNAKKMIAAELYAANLAGTTPQVLCLVGPPGVGKTSLAESMAKASGREFIRIQMSVVKDSDYLMGNIYQQVAANAGKIVREMAFRQTLAPLLYLDEFDKISKETERCLFEILDDVPKIHDRFLDFSLDLTHTQIVISANDLSQIHPALLSRMKVVYLEGYSANEKEHICKEYLLPNIITQNMHVKMDESAIQEVLKQYQNGAGVRSMKHGLQTVVHSCLLEQRDCTNEICIHKEDVARILGPREFIYIADKMTPGCVNGLATYGDSHGMVMPIRCTLLHHGNGEKRVTGLPEATIRDSITLAETMMEEEYGIYLKSGYHLHFSPAGIKKDGPSAGLAVTVAFLSATTGISVDDVAFTGEFDGKNILPVGGVKLKVQAANTAGIKKVYLPEGCRKDIEAEHYENMEIRFVSDIKTVIEELFPSLKNKNVDMVKKVS